LQRRGDTPVGLPDEAAAAPLQNKKEDQQIRLPSLNPGPEQSF
jgi:hypothetical protein